MIKPFDNNLRESLQKMSKTYGKKFFHWAQKRYSADEADILDAYSEAVRIFYENYLKGNYQHQGNLETYIFDIAKKRLNNKVQEIRLHQKLLQEKFPNRKDVGEDTLGKNHHLNHLKASLKNLLSKLRNDERDLIRLSYYSEFCDEAIAREAGLKNANVVKDKRCRILKKLKKMMQSEEAIV